MTTVCVINGFSYVTNDYIKADGKPTVCHRSVDTEQRTEHIFSVSPNNFSLIRVTTVHSR